MYRMISPAGTEESFRIGFRIWGLGFRVWGLGFRIWGLGFRI